MNLNHLIYYRPVKITLKKNAKIKKILHVMFRSEIFYMVATEYSCEIPRFEENVRF